MAAGADTFTHAYESDSYDLIDSITSPMHVSDNAWESNRDVLDSKSNRLLSDNSLISEVDYTVNAIGQRTAVALDGDAFAASASWTWGYNRRGEVVAANHSTNSALHRAYDFDASGNLISKTEGTVVTEYNLAAVTNLNADAELNQYESIKELPSGPTLLPEFDAAGNMTAGPLPTDVSANSTLSWDSENRLISVVRPDAKVVTHTYDPAGRKIRKDLDGTTTPHLYDGWNLIGEYDDAWAAQKTWVWGKDLSGTMRGAGGVGGLLVADETGGSDYHPLFDGNGNVTEYVNGAGAVVAHHEYDPFGQEIVSSGSKAGDFAVKFSSKFEEEEVGVYYYGFRYYDPQHGRWLNRDPIGERGGVNLYGLVGNDGVNWVDYLGLEWVEKDGAINVTGTWANTKAEINIEASTLSGFQMAVILNPEGNITLAFEVDAEVTCECEADGGTTTKTATGKRIREVQTSLPSLPTIITFSGGRKVTGLGQIFKLPHSEILV